MTYADIPYTFSLTAAVANFGCAQIYGRWGVEISLEQDE